MHDRAEVGDKTVNGRAHSIRVTLHQWLRESTRADHLRLESVLNLLDPALSLDRYRRVLAAFHGFYAPLEAQLRRFRPTDAPALGFALARRAPLLAADLAALDSAPVPRRRAHLPEIRTIADFAGRLYVIEGASLGGQVLARTLAARWGLGRDTGIAFFYGAGPRETGRRWRLVLSWLERVAQSSAERRDIEIAASATFRAFERWVVSRVDRR